MPNEFHDDVRTLPAEISTATFARFAHCGRSTVLDMIRKRVIPARVVNPVSKRPTYRIPTWVLCQQLGITTEPELVSRHFGKL